MLIVEVFRTHSLSQLEVCNACAMSEEFEFRKHGQSPKENFIRQDGKYGMVLFIFPEAYLRSFFCWVCCDWFQDNP